MRVLGVIRLSHLTDTTTSPERQREYPERWAAAHDGTVVGIAEDLGVSGAVSPFDRPELGPWLTDDPPEPWDVMVAWRLDRVGRDARDTLNLLHWLEARGKRLVTVADGLDTDGPMAKAFITLAAVFAEMERTVMVERAREGKAALKAAGRWSGGRITYGHRVEDGYLVEDPEKAPHVRQMAAWADDGWNAARIARELNRRGIAAPLGGEWTRWSVRQLLTNPAIIGLGSPPAPSIIEPELFRRIGGKLQGPAQTTRQSPDFGGVIVCRVCGQRMYFRRQRNPEGLREYWYCRTREHTLQIRSDVMAELAVVEFVTAFGDDKVFREIVHPDTTADELAMTWVQLDQNHAKFHLPGADRKALRAERLRLENKIDDLEARPPVALRVERIDTGRTWREEIDRLSTENSGKNYASEGTG